MVIEMNRLKNYDLEEGQIAYCLECKKEFHIETDLLVCQDCMKLFDTDEIWRLHDNNKIDALDFNESKKFRERFRIKKIPAI